MNITALKMPLSGTGFCLLDAVTTASGSNTDTYGRAFTNQGHKGIMVWVPRSADTGTCTSDTYLQGLKPGGTEATDADWYDVAAALTAQFADGDTGTYVGLLYPGIATAAISTTTGLKVNHVAGYLPDRFRLRFRQGGTTVTNTYGNVLGLLLP